MIRVEFIAVDTTADPESAGNKVKRLRSAAIK